MQIPSTPPTNSRIGFHYFPDTAHYRQIDLEAWLPELKSLGAGSVILLAPPTRAIPESFLLGLLEAGIEPVVHFPFHCRSASSEVDGSGPIVPGCIPAPDPCPPSETLRLLLGAYARWGVRRVAFFDRPNLRGMWTPADWLQGDLVERFLDLFLPVAQLAQDEGLTPIFPPLAPGGDYWDLSFLRSALRGLKRRRAASLLNQLILSAEAFPGAHPLDWGAGGPERWPGARPYAPAPDEPDHRGFRIFEWYLAISRQELGAAMSLILLRTGQRQTGVLSGIHNPEAGSSADQQSAYAATSPTAGIAHAHQNIAIAELLVAAPQAGGLPAEVQSGHFWLLSAAERTPAASESWFPPSGRVLPVVGAFQAWTAKRLKADLPAEPAPAVEIEMDERPQPSTEGDVPSPVSTTDAAPSVSGSDATFMQSISSADAQPPATAATSADASVAAKIDHYILLPLYAWGAADWDLALIQPLVQDGHPTIGFSLSEARLARRVTVVGGPGAVSVEALSMLQKSGCRVERLMEDGTLIAS